MVFREGRVLRLSVLPKIRNDFSEQTSLCFRSIKSCHKYGYRFISHGKIIQIFLAYVGDRFIPKNK